MADDKPKHKPQAKRTLEEVLRSLKDLVRNDLTGDVPGSASRPAPPAPPPSPDEPESFNEALSRLDDIIDRKLIQPARSTAPAAPPPAPAAPETDLEIDWDDSDPLPAPDAAPPPTDRPAADAADAAERVPALDAANGDGEYGVDTEPAGPAAAPDPDAAALAALDAIELGPRPGAEPPPSAGVQETFAFPDARRDPTSSGDGCGDEPERGPDAPAQPDDDVPLLLAPGALEREPTPPGEAAHPHAAGAVQEHVDIELEPESRPMSGEHGDDAPGADAAPGTNAARPVAEEPRMPPTPERSPGPAPAAPGNDAAPPRLEDEIPVLQDVAPGEAPPAGALPDVAHARDIAIRVIARINIERRKAGETPLDIRTIERLQRYLAEALTRAASGRS